jgi:hypothetical protein
METPKRRGKSVEWVNERDGLGLMPKAVSNRINHQLFRSSTAALPIEGLRIPISDATPADLERGASSSQKAAGRRLFIYPTSRLCRC